MAGYTRKNILLLIFCCLTAHFQLRAQDNRYPAELTVAADGSGNYSTIQAAVNSVRDLGDQRVIIHIKRGVYREKLIIPAWKTKISLIGESAETTIITGDDFSGKANPGGKDRFGQDNFSTYTSYTVLVSANDFTAENLTIENTAGRVGQAVALQVEGDRSVIRNCRLLGNQDTLYAAGENSRQYYADCVVEGTTDFIFGQATAVFERCTIRSLADSYITAAATTNRQQFGFVFLRCRLLAAAGLRKVYLGRPWRPYAKTVFIHCGMDSPILQAGWDPWKGDMMFPDKEKTVYYAEYASTGTGASAKRVPWSVQLKAEQAKMYTPEAVLSGSDHWNPLAELPARH